MISPIHWLATSAANTIEAALHLPHYFEQSTARPETLAGDLPPKVQQALAEIEDPDQRYLMTLVARGDILLAGVPAQIPGPDLARGPAGVADYLGRLLAVLRSTRADPNAEQIWGPDITENLDESIARVEHLLHKIDPNHPALLGHNKAVPGQLNLLG